MMIRRIAHILLALALPSLSACSGDKQPEPPPSKAAIASITADPGVDRTALARVIDRLFDNDAVGETRALLILRGGIVVTERYGEGYGPKSRLLGWSMSKCITGIAIGLLVSDGRLRRDESAPVPAWRRSGDPRGEVTLRQLLQMRAGLRHDETTEPAHAADTVNMLFLEGRDNMARFAEAQPLEFEPGSQFEYSTATSMILSDIAGRAVSTSSDPATRRHAMSTFLQTRLFAPTGMDSTVVEFDRAGTMLGSSMIHANGRDWARLGEFLRNHGSVGGVQVVPRRWIEFMLSPSPRNPGYGAQVWLNRPQSDDSVVLFPGRAPKSLFACLGHLGQYVVSSPAQKLTVVRLGHTDDDEQEDLLRERIGDLVSLFPRI